ncbi:MAG: hypothetical protein K5928_01430, partial [Prevotella sp.]|nr:hypothetical protein [Prevotella sp.]
MKLHLTILSFMLLASSGMKAQNSPFSAVKKGEIINRAAMPADNQDVKIRRAARKAPQVNWSYPSAMPATPFAGGNGTQAAPYQIATAQHLANLAWLVNNMSSYRSLYYELTADIELNKDVLNEERALNVAGAPWTPIGSRYAAFSGHFNGNGHSVKGLYIYSTQEYTGLFGYASNAVIENVGTVDGYIYGCCRTGAIAGCVTNTTIQNCFNSNTMYSKSSLLAGILGHSEGSTKVVACYNSGIVYGYGQYCGSHGRNGNCVGGIVGAVDQGGSVSYCYNTGSVYCGAYGAGG